MKTRTAAILLFFFSSIFFFSFSIDDEALKKLINNFQKFSSENQQEKIHLHFDKPYYSIGDEIWLKSYVVDAESNKLSTLSKVLYIDLIDEQDQVKRKIILPLENGLSEANITLADSLFSPGKYLIRAYTKWMKNYDTDFFYYKEIQIGNALNENIFASANFEGLRVSDRNEVLTSLNYKNYVNEPQQYKEVTYNFTQDGVLLYAGKGKTDVNGNLSFTTKFAKNVNLDDVILETNIKPVFDGQVVQRIFRVNEVIREINLYFFPEGGYLVNGLRSRVAFKAIDERGFGIDVSGYIEDNKGNRITDFSSSHLGMGLFALSPNLGNTYTAVVTDRSGKVSRFPLPIIKKNGYVLSVNNLNDDEILIKVQVNDTDETEGRKILLFAQSNGKIIYVSNVKITNKIASIVLDKSKFPFGIVQFTIFTSNNLPIAERLFFNFKKNTLIAQISSDKNIYGTRENVNMPIKIKDEQGKGIVGSFSVSVTNSDQVKIKEEQEVTILSNLLLSSDLKGKIEMPNYYFVNTDNQKLKQLDILMLTQGWRRFNWVNILNGEKNNFAYLPENGLNISGTVVTNIGGKIIPKAKIGLFSQKLMMLIDTTADESGRFKIDQLHFTDSALFILRSKGIDGKKNNVRIILDKDELFTKLDRKNYDISFTANDFVSYLKASQDNFNELVKGNKMSRGITLKEVTIRSSKLPQIYNSKLPKDLKANFVFTPEKLETAGDLKLLLWHLIPLRSSTTARLYVLDGQRISEGMVEQLNAMSLAGVEVLIPGPQAASAAVLYGAPGFKGMIIFLTTEKRPGKSNLAYKPSGQTSINVNGYTVVKEFYNPIYTNENDNNKIKDLRTTVYWNPNVITNANGEANMNFYTNDVAGSYLVTVEGIGVEGQLIRQTYNFKVKN